MLNDVEIDVHVHYLFEETIQTQHCGVVGPFAQLGDTLLSCGKLTIMSTSHDGGAAEQPHGWSTRNKY